MNVLGRRERDCFAGNFRHSMKARVAQCRALANLFGETGEAGVKNPARAAVKLQLNRLGQASAAR
jgi:hypothetical protein